MLGRLSRHYEAYIKGFRGAVWAYTSHSSICRHIQGYIGPIQGLYTPFHTYPGLWRHYSTHPGAIHPQTAPLDAHQGLYTPPTPPRAPNQAYRAPGHLKHLPRAHIPLSGHPYMPTQAYTCLPGLKRTLFSTYTAHSPHLSLNQPPKHSIGADSVFSPIS